MFDTASCFDVFEMFSNSLRMSSRRHDMIIGEQAQAQVWLALCNETGRIPRQVSHGHQYVKKSRPVVAQELTIVKSCKRKVRW